VYTTEEFDHPLARMPKKQEKKTQLMSEKKQQQMLAEELVRRTHCKRCFREILHLVITKSDESSNQYDQDCYAE